jgi:multidrug efflux pump subunit AcrA (membrane-fusion protein)
VHTWRGSDHSVNASRLRIAEVGRGTLIRDAAVNGRVVAAVSPTLYAPSLATVTLKVHAGDTVKKGDVLAVLESPDLSDALKREQAAYAQIEADVARQRILARKQNCWPSATPTPPKSTASRPSARWSATTPSPTKARSPRSNTSAPRMR